VRSSPIKRNAKSLKSKEPSLEMSPSISMPSISSLSSSEMMHSLKSKLSSFGMSGDSGLLSMGSSLGLGSKFGGMMKMPCCKGMRMRGGYRGGSGGMGYSSVMPGLGDKSVEREVRKYVDDQTLSMLLYKAIATTKPKKKGRGKGRRKKGLHYF